MKEAEYEWYHRVLYVAGLHRSRQRNIVQTDFFIMKRAPSRGTQNEASN
jgi:hypothetical protein